MNLLWIIIDGVFLFLFKQVLGVFHHINFNGVTFLTFCLGTVFVGLIFKIFLEADPFSIKSNYNDDSSPKHKYNRFFKFRNKKVYVGKHEKL